MKPVHMKLMSLKCLLFIFFGGLGCLLAYLVPHMRKIGLNTDEIHIISIVSPCVAIIGPILVGPLADRLGVPAQGSTARYGRYMRFMLVLVTVLGAVFYSALLFVPPVSRLHARNPAVTFTCNATGGVIMQERCLETPCYDWPVDNEGQLFLSGCHYDCGDGPITPFSARKLENGTELDPVDEDTELDDDELHSSGGGDTDLIVKGRRRRQTNNSDIIEPPHICVKSNNNRICHVYTQFSEQLAINVSLQPSPELISAADWCTYKVVGDTRCNLPFQNDSCSVVCDLDDPYTRSDSLLIESQCKQTIGDPDVTFRLYLVIRSIADIFPTTAVTLLASLLIVAARDGPSLIGQQMIFGLLGFAVLPPVVFMLSNVLPEIMPTQLMFISFATLSLISALIIIFDRSLPLSPVDYHLHSGTGQLTIKGAGGETGALMFILVLFGILSTALDNYFPLISFPLGILPCVIFLWYANIVIDYCGYSNLLIASFALYIIRYTGLLMFTNHWAFILLGTLEMFTLVIVFATAALYLRHLVPRHLSVTGQAVAIIACFCIGRAFGEVASGLLGETNPSVKPTEWTYISYDLYELAAIFAAIISSVYFIIYHCCLKPFCKKPNNQKKYRNPQAAVYGSNSNGTYTPLKIYNPPEVEQVKGQQKRY